MDYRYFSDTNANYLVIRRRDLQEAEYGYQYRMLAVNSVKGLLPCGIRFIDGRQYIYYDITSRQNLADLYSSRTMDGPLIKRLLYEIAAAGENLGNYLLDDDRILLRPEFIYYDFCKDSYAFVYYPDDPEGGDPGEYADGEYGNPETAAARKKTGAEELFAFLISHCDPSDTENAYILYRLSEAAGYPGFRLQKSMLDLAFRNYEESPKTEEEGITFLDDDYPDPPEQQEERRYEDPGEAYRLRYDGQPVHGKLRYQERNEAEDLLHCRPGIFLIAAAVMLSAAVVLELMVQKIILPVIDLDPWKLQIRAGVLTLVFLSVLSAGAGIYMTHHSRKAARGTQEDLLPASERMTPVRSEEYTVQINAVKQTGNGTNESLFYDRTGHYPGAAAVMGDERTGSADDACRRRKQQNKLYGTGAARQYRIDLNNLPCTVGRNPEYADFILRDPCISPVHVRFEADGGQILMTDLNSVSGTWLNGEKLSVRSPEIIYPEDEIRIGELVFIYR